jgi:hypothetical protein
VAILRKVCFLALSLALAGCSARSNDTTAREPAESGPPHGGRAIDLGATERAELVVDGTGMIVVRLYDRSWRLLDPAGKTVDVQIETPDSAAIDIATEPMGTGSAAHFMAPMDKAVVAHVQDMGSYVATVRAVIDGRHVQGSASVKGLATGGQGM